MAVMEQTAEQKQELTLTFPREEQSRVEAVLRGEWDAPDVTSPRLVLDIGANVGAWSIWARHRWHDADILAYETDPTLADHWRKNCGATGAQLNDKPINPAEIPTGASVLKVDVGGHEMEILPVLDFSAAQSVIVAANGNLEARHAVENHMAARGFYLQDWVNYGSDRAMLRYVPKPTQKLFIAIPTYGGIHGLFLGVVQNLIAQGLGEHKYRIHFHPGDSLVTRARNSLTGEFMRSDCDQLLWIDSDLIFGTWHVVRMLEHKEDVVGGMYPKKQEGPINWVCNVLDQKTDPRDDGLQPVRYIGTGFLKTRRSAIARMIDAYRDQIEYHTDHDRGRIEWDLWPVGVYKYPDGNRRYLSEDWYFCQRWLDMGGIVWADTRVVLRHIGTAIYPLQSQTKEIIK